MSEYPKIQTLYKRHIIKGPEPSKLLIGEWSLPELEYLKDAEWIWTEKIDGTNIRVYWDGEKVTIRGRTSRAQIPPHLSKTLHKLFDVVSLTKAFPEIEPVDKFILGKVVLYGEGYGNKIQKVGKIYKPDGTDFILFDVKIGHNWMPRYLVDTFAKALDIQSVPVVGYGRLDEAVNYVKKGFKSQLADVGAEGVICRPKVELRNRMGHRVITKIKHSDFNDNNL